jgi:hypothetical protein
LNHTKNGGYPKISKVARDISNATLNTPAASVRSSFTTFQKTIGKFSNICITAKQEKTVAAKKIENFYTETPLNGVLVFNNYRLNSFRSTSK